MVLRIAKLYFDGASKKTRRASCGWHFACNEIEKEGFVDLGYRTSNEAEYSGLVHGLQNVFMASPDITYVYGDSKLVIEQMKGSWKVKSPILYPLWRNASDMCMNRTVIFTWIPRKQNWRADSLANRALAPNQNT